MSFKKWMALAMMIALLLTGVVGCKSTDSGEESAITDEYVESDPADAPEAPQDAPVKVENPEGVTVDEPEEEPEGEPEEQPEEQPDEEPGESTEEPSNTPSEEPSDPSEDEPEVKYDEKNKIKVVSYNVRCADDGDNKNISDRGPRLDKVIDMYDPDIIGFQEVTPIWRTLLEEYFSDKYEYVYQERSPGGECTPIFWKTDKFEMLKSDHFWLSETPDVSSIGFGGQHYRVCTWTLLKNKATGVEFLYFNTHLDFSAEQHVPSVNLMMNRARAAGGFSKYGVIFTADWNMNPWKQGYNALVESGEMSDVNYDLENLSDGTCNGYNEGDGSGGSIIDMCFYSPAKIAPVDYKVINEKIDGGWVSDHRGIYMELALL